ncbi:Pyridoxal-dependent decarboxylase domain-containing protein 1 [Nymphon striatum]|nr:Pyridoxal-dependent decarboxylase domain-containing protein 1 [Nymphon striatum]
MAEELRQSPDLNPKEHNVEPIEDKDEDISENSCNSSTFVPSFSNPSLSQLEQMALESTSFLQRVGSNLSDDEASEQVLKAGPLSDGGLVFSDIMKSLEDILSSIAENEVSDEEIVPSVLLQTLDDPAKISVVSHTLAAYLSTLEPKNLRKLATRIRSDCSLWISRLFRFFESSAYFHDESRDGLLKITKMVLFSKYPKYAVDGFDALYARPPVIYISDAAKTGLGHYLCYQLGLPLSCISTVPCNTIFGSHHKMDIAVLEKLVADDTQTGKVPLIIIGNAGTPVIGDTDNVQRLQDLCRENDIWLHVEGNSLAALCLVSVPNLPARVGDSITLHLGQWLGIPSVPYITLYKTSETSFIHAAGLDVFHLHLKLNCLPLWVSLHSLGHDGVVRRIKHCFELNKYLHGQLCEVSSIKILSGQEVSKEAQNLGLSDVMNKTLSTSLLFEILFPTVVFQYSPKIESEDTETKIHRDHLNSWISQVLMRDAPKVGISFMDIKENGVIIRYCSLESAHVNGTTKEDIDDFIKVLKFQVSIMDATLALKQKFILLVNDKPNLQFVALNNWAGLGGVRYIPELWVDRLSELPDSGKEEVNKLNAELVAQLKNFDSAFSLGEGVDGLDCVRFGMVLAGTDMEDLIDHVDRTGKEIEESSKFLETMAELIRQGINAANKDLEKENESRLMKEGVLRHVPLVGSFVNWWSPLSNDMAVKGRSFNLQSGVVESTENTYKYHMQIQHGSKTIQEKPVTGESIVPDENDETHPSSSVSSISIEKIDPEKELSKELEPHIQQQVAAN